MADFFSSCSKLEKLHLRDYDMEDTIPNLTLDELHAALQNAPQLQELTLRFDAQTPFDVKTPSQPPSGSPILLDNGTNLPKANEPQLVPLNSRLRLLDVCTSPLRVPSTFLDWLTKYHPHVQNVAYFAPFKQGLAEVYEHPLASGRCPDLTHADGKLFEKQLYTAMMFDLWNDVASALGRRLEAGHDGDRFSTR